VLVIQVDREVQVVVEFQVVVEQVTHLPQLLRKDHQVVLVVVLLDQVVLVAEQQLQVVMVRDPLLEETVVLEQQHLLTIVLHLLLAVAVALPEDLVEPVVEEDLVQMDQLIQVVELEQQLLEDLELLE
jgi:hypothetical protein